MRPVTKLISKWIIDKILHLASNNEFSKKREEIEKLRQGFSIPILKGKLSRRLLKIKQSGMGDSELFENLSDIYKFFELYKKVNQKEKEKNSPRILYSKYVEKR